MRWRTSMPSTRAMTANAACHSARASGNVAAGSGPIGLAGVVPAEHLPVGAEPPGLGLPLRARLQDRRGPGRGPGWPTAGPRARRARRCGAAGRPSPRRPRPCTGPAPGRRTSAALAVQESRIAGGRSPVISRIRASRTAEWDRAPVNGRPVIAARITSAPSSPASSAERTVRHSRSVSLRISLGVRGLGVVADRLGVPARRPRRGSGPSRSRAARRGGQRPTAPAPWSRSRTARRRRGGPPGPGS